MDRHIRQSFHRVLPIGVRPRVRTKPSGSPLLFGAQRDHRIEPRCLPGRNVAGE